MKNFKLIALASIITLTSMSLLEAKGTCKKGMHWDFAKAACVKNNTKSKNKDAKITAEQKLIEAIDNRDRDTILKILSKNKKSNLNIVNLALNLTPDNSAYVRCMKSNPYCGISPTRRMLLAIQKLLEKEGEIRSTFIDDLFSKFTNAEESNGESISPTNLMGGNPKTFGPRTFEPSSKFSGDGLIGNYFSATQVATIHDPSGKNKKSYNFNEVEEYSSYAINTQAPEGLEFIGSFMSSPKCPAGQMCTMAMKEISLYGKQASGVMHKHKMKGMYPVGNGTIDDDQFYHVDDPNYTMNLKNNMLGIRAPEDMPEQNKKQSGSGQIYY